MLLGQSKELDQVMEHTSVDAVSGQENVCGSQWMSTVIVQYVSSLPGRPVTGGIPVGG